MKKEYAAAGSKAAIRRSLVALEDWTSLLVNKTSLMKLGEGGAPILIITKRNHTEAIVALVVKSPFVSKILRDLVCLYRE